MPITSTVNLVIQKARLTDLQQLAALEQQVFDDVVYPAFFFARHWIYGRIFYYWPGKVTAWLVTFWQRPGSTAPERIGILSLAVLPSAQGLGIGKKLLQALLELVPSDCRQLWLTVAPDNQAALALYQKFGFFCEKTEADYYGKGEGPLVTCEAMSSLKYAVFIEVKIAKTRR